MAVSSHLFFEKRNNTWNTPYLFNAKELDEETGLYYYGARYYNPRTSVWLSTDPLQEKYPNISTYAYCALNPIKFIDPDGRDVVISGPLKGEALEQIQAGAGEGVSLKLDENGNLCYTLNTSEPLTGAARQIVAAIDNSSIIIGLETIDSFMYGEGIFVPGGTFGGNELYKDQNNESVVVAHQIINPNVMNRSEELGDKPGQIIFHEIMEAYFAAADSKLFGSSAIPEFKGGDGSRYKSAHRQADRWYQSPAIQILPFNEEGKPATGFSDAVKLEIYMVRGDRRIHIGTENRQTED